MPTPTTSPSAEILTLPQEDRIQLAITAITNAGHSANGTPLLSIRQAATAYQVPRSTLGDRMKGLRTRAEAHVDQQNLSLAEEEVLVKWAKVMGRRGVPLTYLTLTNYASEISGKPIGESWPKRFLARHPELKVKATTSLEKCRAKALNRAAVEGFYDILEEVLADYHIKKENIWNMDEKGVQLGIGAKVAAIVDRDQATAYSVEDGNRELVTIIEAVCANGTALIPSVIFQGVRRNPEWGRAENNPSSASVSVSPKGWTDQELGMKWLERDFEPNTRPQMSDEFRLLILDGHNSHCTYSFTKFSAQHHIIIICLPSHTTHALQPCDVGVFGPLTHAWKSQVTQASQNNIPITKDNLLRYYHRARSAALKTSTIQSAFRKTGIYPFNRDAIPATAFEPAKNTTTQAAQPMPAQLPPSLVPTPNPSPAVSGVTTSTPNSTPVTSVAPSSVNLDVGFNAPTLDSTNSQAFSAVANPRTQRYHIMIPPPLPHTTSRKALRQENNMLREIIERAGVELEQDFAQMKLMDLENERLRQKAFAKDQRKAAKRKLTSGQARHMTAPEMLDLLARQTWESAMEDLFKEASGRFKALRKAIDDHHKQLAADKKAEEKARKADERHAKKLEAEAEKERMRAERATRGRGRGSRVRGGQGRGERAGRRGRGYRARGSGAAVTTSQDSEEQTSDSDSTTHHEHDDIPILATTTTQRERRPQRECRTRAPRFFADEDELHVVADRPMRPRPRPRPIQARQVTAALEPSSAHTSTQAPGSTIGRSSQLG